MSLIKISRENQPHIKGDKAEGKNYCQELEKGNILFFDYIPFDLPAESNDFLLSIQQKNTRFHKNISYRPKQNTLHGFPKKQTQDFAQLTEIMQDYSRQVATFVNKFLSPYSDKLLLDYASFRPIEEEGRQLPLRKRNDLLHVDAFPSRPTWGGRILRVFTNINPHQSRVWVVSDVFDQLAKQYALQAGLLHFQHKSNFSLWQAFYKLIRTLKKTGLPVVDRSTYDRFMLHFHNYLKENSDFQNECRRIRLEFPPNSTWMVFTDGVPHSVLSGQFALEQTIIVPFGALVDSKSSPAYILDKMCQQSLITN